MVKMKNKISVLITASGSLAATSLIDCLKNNDEKRTVRVVCTDVYEQPILHYKADSFHLLPKGNSKDYIKSLINICKKEKIDVVLPCSGSEVLSISKNLDLLHSNKIFPTVSNLDTIQKTMSKYKVYKILEKNKNLVPKHFVVRSKREFLKALKKLGYPVKPICFKPSKYTLSGGGKGFRILRDKNSIDNIIFRQRPDSQEIDYETCLRLFEENKSHEILVMEYLPGDELGVYALANKGKMVYSVCIQVFSSERGFAADAIIQKNKKLTSICENIIKTMNFDFNVHIQFKLSEEKIPKLIEINPRIAGAISLPMAAGINLPFLAVKLALGEKLSNHKVINKMRMIRYWKELYVKNGKYFEFSQKKIN